MDLEKYLKKREDFIPIQGRTYPRYCGVRTFFRLPLLTTKQQWKKANVAIMGVPFDGGVSFRPGARFGPEAIRSASALMRGYHPTQHVHVFEQLNVADAGDCEVTPQDIDQTHKQIHEQVQFVLQMGCIPLIAGGDHSITIGVLQALFEQHGPLCVVHFDAHTDVYPPAWDCNVHHGTFMRLAHERGWLQPGGVLQIGLRGHFADAQDVQAPKDLGFTVVTTDDIQTGGLQTAQKAIEQLPKGPVYVTFDIDCLDPAYAPGTGTPVPGGLSSWQALQLLRCLASCNIVGGDVVEVAPVYDHGDITSLAAASILWEMLAALAKQRG